jgi:hypothetical protein
MTGFPAAIAAAKSPPATPLYAKGKLFGPKIKTGPSGASRERMFNFVSIVGSTHEPSSLRALRRRPGATGRWWGQFHLREARRFRQRRFHGRHFDEFGFARFDVFSEARQKLRDLFRRHRAKCGCSFGGGGERGIAIRPGADGIFSGQHFTGGRIFGAEGAGGCRRAPLAGDENGLV